MKARLFFKLLPVLESCYMLGRVECLFCGLFISDNIYTIMHYMHFILYCRFIINRKL